MDIVSIRSRANPRYKLARSLLTKKGRQQHTQLLLEGVRLIEDSISAGFPPALVLFDRQLADGLGSLLDAAKAAGAELLSLEPDLLAELCDTTTPQGVVAVTPQPTLTPGRRGLQLILDGVRDPGNLGAILRSAAAADVDEVLFLPGVTDPWAAKALRAGMGAQFRVAIRQVRDAAAVEAHIASARRYVAAMTASTLYTEVDWTLPSALVVGGETEGMRYAGRLSDAQAIAIPMARGVESLNAAVAASVILFEAVRQRRQAAV